MKKTVSSILFLILASAFIAKAETIELITNGAGTTLDGWTQEGQAGFYVQNDSDGVSWFRADDENMSLMNQTVTLADAGITEEELAAGVNVTVSVTAISEVPNAGCTAVLSEFDSAGGMIATSYILNKSKSQFSSTQVAINIALKPSTRTLRYALFGYASSSYDKGPAFRACSIAVTRYEITFVSGDDEIASTNSFSLASVTPPAVPAKDGYKFLGYYTAASGGERVFDANYAYALDSSSTWTPSDETTLYAHWETLYSISFVSQTDTLGTGVYTASEGGTAPIPSRKGDYTFLGYYTSDGVQVFDANGDYVSGTLDGISTADLTLYANWAVPEGSIAELVYRGQLTKQGTDEPATNDTSYVKTMGFRVYEDESAETPIWQIEGQEVTVNKDGSFMATFGDATLAELIATGSVSHVEVAIGESEIELKPRRELRPVAVVNRALVAEAAGKNPRIGNLVSENALAASHVMVSQLEVSGTVTAPGAGAVDVSPLIVGEGETLTLLRGGGVRAFSSSVISLGESDNVLRGQKVGTSATPSDGIALITSRADGTRAFRVPAVVQYCRKGDWARAPASDAGGVKVTFFPFAGK